MDHSFRRLFQAAFHTGCDDIFSAHGVVRAQVMLHSSQSWN